MLMAPDTQTYGVEAAVSQSSHTLMHRAASFSCCLTICKGSKAELNSWPHGCHACDQKPLARDRQQACSAQLMATHYAPNQLEAALDRQLP